MDEVHLKINPAKTEYMYFGNQRQINKYTESSINVAGNLIIRSDIIRYLSVRMDAALNLKTSHHNKVSSCNDEFLKIKKHQAYTGHQDNG